VGSICRKAEGLSAKATTAVGRGPWTGSGPPPRGRVRVSTGPPWTDGGEGMAATMAGAGVFSAVAVWCMAG